MSKTRVAVLLLALGCSHEDGVDLLVVAPVYTLDWPAPDADGRPNPASSWTEAHGWRPTAGALAVDGGEVVWLGSPADAERYRARADRVIERGDAAVLPRVAGAAGFLASLASALGVPDSTVEQAVRARVDGAIVVGGPAHLTVVTPDPFSTATDAWAAGRVLFTIDGGEVREGAR